MSWFGAEQVKANSCIRTGNTMCIVCADCRCVVCGHPRCHGDVAVRVFRSVVRRSLASMSIETPRKRVRRNYQQLLRPNWLKKSKEGIQTV